VYHRSLMSNPPSTAETCTPPQEQAPPTTPRPASWTYTALM
jgi:hypothetical protein